MVVDPCCVSYAGLDQIGVISLGFDEAALKIKLENKEALALKQITQAAGKRLDGRLTEQQIESLRIIFETVDFDSQGDISRNEFVPLLEMLCVRFGLVDLDNKILNDMYDVVDISGDGTLSFPEYCWLMLFLRNHLCEIGTEVIVNEEVALGDLAIKIPDCTIGAEFETVKLGGSAFGGKETGSVDGSGGEDTKAVVEGSLSLARTTTQHIHNATAQLNAVGDGLSDDLNGGDGYSTGSDIDSSTCLAYDCKSCQRARVSPSVETPQRDFDDESYQKLIDVLQDLGSVASTLRPAAGNISDAKAREGLLSLLEKLTSLPAMPREDLHCHALLQRADIVHQAITATGQPPPPLPPSRCRKMKTRRHSKKKKSSSSNQASNKPRSSNGAEK